MAPSNELKYGKSTIPEEYEKLQADRSPYLSRGRDYSKFTLPYILPEEGSRGSDANQHGFQGLGAEAVNHLANKITMTLFPPQRSFFKLELTDEAKKSLVDQGVDPTSISEQLAQITTKTKRVEEDMQTRVVSVNATKQLIITGNTLLHLPKKGKASAIPIDRYVVKRSLSDELLVCIIKETKSLNSFDSLTQSLIKATAKGRNLKPHDDVDLYTKASLNGELYEVTQSAFDLPIGSKLTVRKEELPWIPLRWNTCYGEAYGRGLVEDHAGDFYVIELLSRAIARGMVLMAEVKYLVKPGAVTDIDHLVESPSGEYITGNIDDIGVLQLEKYADFSPISAVLSDYEKRIGRAFLLSSANRRDAERVTAYELRLDANELETALGGVYSHFAQSWQKPAAMLYLKRVNGKISNQDFEPVVLTGLEALGLSGDLDKIMQFTEIMQLPNSWPQAMQQRVKWDIYGRSVAATLAMEVPWLMTREESEAAEEREQQAMMMQTAGAEASKAIPGMLQDSMGGKK